MATQFVGTFWIDFTDFCHFFKRVHSCRLFGDRETSGRVSSWSVESAGGCMKYAESFANNPHFLLKGAGVVTIVLSQDEVTNSGVDENETKIIETVAVGIYAFRTGGYPLAPGTLPSFNQLVSYDGVQMCRSTLKFPVSVYSNNFFHVSSNRLIRLVLLMSVM